MSHAYIDGTVYHKRFVPTTHSFTYNFFMLYIDVAHMHTLRHRFFSYNRFNLFSFYAKDHFGKGDDFQTNVQELLKTFQMQATDTMCFITLPRIMHYTFNPISALLLLKNDRPYAMLVEVHNYNGGRTIYPAILEKQVNGSYRALAQKDMYVSPFFDTKGVYMFSLFYSDEMIKLSVTLEKEGETQLIARFSGILKPFNKHTTLQMFKKHTLLTLWVVTRTLWQSLQLWRKKLPWHSPRPIDQIQRF